MEKGNPYIFVLLFLLSFLTVRAAERRFDKREIRDCVAHNLDATSPPLSFPLGFRSTRLVVETKSPSKVDLTVKSINNFDNLVLQYCNHDSFCASCKRSFPIPLPLENAFRLSFFKNSVAYLSHHNMTIICPDFSIEFPEELSIDFQLVDAHQFSFKGSFTFNCKEETCWLFPELSIQVSPKVLQKQVFYFKSSKENGTASLKGPKKIDLLPSRWWKKLTLMIEEEKTTRAKILFVREEDHLILSHPVGAVTLNLKMVTESSPEVFWTEGCLPQQTSAELENTRNATEERDGPESEESFLGSGLSKATFLQIVLFGAALLITAVVAIISTLCAMKCIRKKQTPLRHLETPLGNKEKSKSVSSDALKHECVEEYDEPDVRYSALKPRTGRGAIPETMETVSLTFPETTESNTDSDEETNGYMEMRPFTHLLQKNEPTDKGPLATIYESLGSLIDEGNKRIYDTVNELN